MYLFGMLVALLHQGYWAGKNPDHFTPKSTYSTREGEYIYYWFMSFLGALIWPVSIPVYVAFKAGSKKIEK